MKLGREFLGLLVFSSCLSLAGAPAWANGDSDADAPQAVASDERIAELAAKFGKREDVLDVALSPDGNRIAVLTAGPGATTYVQWSDLSGGALSQVTGTDGKPNQLRWCEFSAADRLICNIYLILNDGTDDVAFARLVSMGLDGKDPLVLGQRASDFDSTYRQSSGRVVDWMEGDGKVLMAQQYIPEERIGTLITRDEEGLGVVELDTRNNRTKMVERPNRAAVGYWGDGTDGIRLVAYEVEQRLGESSLGGYRLDYRTPGSREWRRFGTYDVNQAGRSADFWPSAIDAGSNSVYGIKSYEGRDALFRVSLDGNLTEELVFAHPEVDVAGVVRFGQGGRVVGVAYTDDVPRIEYFDKGLSALHRGLTKALPGNPQISFVDASIDETKLLVQTGSDVDPGRYYVYDKKTGQLGEIMRVRSALEGETLAPMEPVRYAAADGTAIPGYLTLPPGKTRADAKNLPAIVMPHGGPSARDVWGFDWLPQFFASLGYAVLQPNYRGSAGYGDQWFEQNGFIRWRTAIGDVNDGGRWLVDQGIADPDKMAIVGWSYGGYSALQSGVVEPGLFKAIAAIAPVTDMNDWVSELRNFTSYRTREKYVGSGPHLVEGSPLQHVQSITAPVILFHGDKDLNVGVRQSRRMESALKAAGKSVEYHEFKDLDHDLPDSNARTFMLTKIAQFLAENLDR